jgi:hypothetical protein
MKQNQVIDWWQKCFYSVLQKVAITAMATIAMLGILGSATPMSYASVVLNSNRDIQATLAAIIPNINVYRSPECTCCGGWIDNIKTQGFEIQDFLTPDIEAVKQKYKVPDNLVSCHTAIVNGYVLEGHVPANDIKRLLQEKPNVSGLAVPQMPVGTPGMEMGTKKDPFTVLSFDRQNAIMVFNDYPSRVD